MRICCIMYTIKLVEKASRKLMTKQTTVLENLVIRNGKKLSHNNVYCNYLGSPT